MKKLITLVASLAVCAGFALYAQNDSRQAGIYSVMNGESTLLPFFKGINSNAGTTVLGVEVGKKKSTYNGATSGVLSDNSFSVVTEGLPTGEYAVVIRPTGLSPLDFSCVFGFTVEAPAEE